MARNTDKDDEIVQFPFEENNIRRSSKSSWIHNDNEDEYFSLQSEVIVHKEEETLETSFVVSPASLSVISAIKNRRRRKSDNDSCSVQSSTSYIPEIDTSNVVDKISPSVAAYESKKNGLQSPSMTSPVGLVKRVVNQSELRSPSVKSRTSIVSETDSSNIINKSISSSYRERKNQFLDATSWKSNDYESDVSSHIRSNHSTSITSHHFTELKSRNIYESTPQHSPKDSGSRLESTNTSEDEANKYTSGIHGLSSHEYIRPGIQVEKDDNKNISNLSGRPQRPTRTLDKLDNMQAEEPQTSDYKGARTKWKAAATSIKVGSLDCETTSAYDFFTQVHQHSANEQQPVPVKDEELVEDNPQIENEESMNKPLTADYLGLKEEDWGTVFISRPKIQFKKSEIIAQEKEIYFYPSNKPVSLKEKLGSNCEPRYLEDEGLYVGFRPKIPRSTKLHLEQRLIASGQNNWFGIDGNLNTLPDPFTKTIFNPIVLEENSPSVEVEYKMPIPVLPPNKSLLEHSESKYLLEMKLLSIKFTHHPLFSREHVLAQSLIELHQQFVARMANMREDRLAGHLEALRRARDNAVSGKNDDCNHIDRYADEIEATRLTLMAEGKTSRNLLINILTTWKNIKHLREIQGYSSTPVKLYIQKQSTNLEEERKKWDDMVKRECEEALKAQQIKYNTRLSEWKKQHKKMNYTERNGEGGFRQDPEETGIKPPAPVDLATVKSEVIECLKESFRPPGEPQLLFNISTNNPIDLDPQCQREKQRRSAVSRSRIFVKVFYNDKEVCQSRSMPLGSLFEVSFNQLFSICIQHLPKSLKAEIHEEINSLNRHIVAEVYIPIPNSTTVLDRSTICQHEFSNSEVQTFSHTGVGSGTHIQPLPGIHNKSSVSACLYTSGVLECQVGWGMDDSSGEALGPNLKSSNSDELLEFPSNLNGMNRLSNISKLQEWVKKSHLDPNDPTNSALFYLLKNADNWESVENNYFRLNPLGSYCDFCTMEELDSNSRLQLLRLRDKGEPEFRGLQFIPLFEKEITRGFFKEYEKRLAEQQDPSSCISMLPPDPLESHRAWGQRFLLNVRQLILKQCHTAQQNRQLHEIVAEEQVPDIGTLGLTFVKWLQPKRPLHPKRKERKCLTVQNLAGQEVKIIVNVVRAFDIPVRKDIDTLSNSIGSQGFKFNIVPVRPFVEICFQNVIARTTTAEGANPSWNEELNLPLQTPSTNYSAGCFESIKDTIHLNLFDEIVVDLLDDDRKRETNIHQRLERNWLGSLRIPFSTLYYNSRIEGIFKLYSPSVLLGYEREPQQLQINNIPSSGEVQQTYLHNATFITLFITVQPALHPPEPFKEKLETNELPHLQDQLEKWEVQVLSLFPQRKVKSLVIDISGKSVCVTRFFRSLAPPVIGNDNSTTEQQAARFVSMIPVITGNTLFPGLFDVWLTADQVLQLLSGDCEDHAILLCCYLQYLGKKVWLLLGTGIPHGHTAYVLTREKSDYFVWDPVSGQKYNVFDTFCPVQKVYSLLNEENIWANIQQDEAPRSMRFDISRKSDWMPAFGRQVSAPAESIQPTSLVYNETSNTAVQLLQDKIEKQLRGNLMHWRKTARTIWNRYCISILRKLLPEMEYATWSTKETKLGDHIEELQHILGSHKVCGFPINMAYTNIEAITECVKATGVHFNESDEVEFALAVYIHPYPNNVFSVWIYVASLIQRR